MTKPERDRQEMEQDKAQLRDFLNRCLYSAEGMTDGLLFSRILFVNVALIAFVTVISLVSPSLQHSFGVQGLSHYARAQDYMALQMLLGVLAYTILAVPFSYLVMRAWRQLMLREGLNRLQIIGFSLIFIMAILIYAVIQGSLLVSIQFWIGLAIMPLIYWVVISYFL